MSNQILSKVQHSEKLQETQELHLSMLNVQ